MKTRYQEEEWKEGRRREYIHKVPTKMREVT